MRHSSYSIRGNSIYFILFLQFAAPLRQKHLENVVQQLFAGEDILNLFLSNNNSFIVHKYSYKFKERCSNKESHHWQSL